ncbi:hypothetical protein [uncultured Christiangramia sp.]|uniref:hypothetical protein n=1 Tax=uncultured Christiangramia sp. TaxID=503836 RepID=UPI0026306278|nr:hypothetical protein [uncultured Christiangramia sp.]
MARHPKQIGICRLCGIEGYLTFEHVPPRSSYNKNTKYFSIDFMEYVQSEDIINNPPKGKIKQGGIGYNSLCSKCNSFLGTEYVNAYSKWTQTGAQIISENNFKFAIVSMIKQEPLKILKEVISMFVAINDEWYLEAYPELAEFVKNPKMKELPAKFRIFMYLNDEGGTRYMNHSGVYKPELGGTVNCTEITFPPFGYLLTIGFNYDINILTNITHFKNYDYKQVVDLKLPLFKLPVYSPFPLDYRSKVKMNIDIKNSLLKKKEFENSRKIRE